MARVGERVTETVRKASIKSVEGFFSSVVR
jgi:hypothetical protein